METPARSTHAIVTEPISLEALTRQIETPAAGAQAIFTGVVRGASMGRRVRHLFYEAYPPMALRELDRIERELRERWELLRVAMAHRVGRLEIGEVSVVVAVASAHRREALQACAWGIERIKQNVPIWKKEYWEGGEVWLENESGSKIIKDLDVAPVAPEALLP